MRFGMVGWMGPGMRQIVGFGNFFYPSMGRGNFWSNVRCPIVTNGEFVASWSHPKLHWNFLLNIVSCDNELFVVAENLIWNHQYQITCEDDMLKMVENLWT